MPLIDNNGFDYRLKSDPICPHCDEEILVSKNELYELYAEGEHEIKCPNCSKQIVVISTAIFSFSTDEQPD